MANKTEHIAIQVALVVIHFLGDLLVRWGGGRLSLSDREDLYALKRVCTRLMGETVHLIGGYHETHEEDTTFRDSARNMIAATAVLASIDEDKSLSSSLNVN